MSLENYNDRVKKKKKKKFNKQSGLSFILTQKSMRGNEYGKSGHLSIFTLLEHLMMLLKANFFSSHGFIITPFQRHW